MTLYTPPPAESLRIVRVFIASPSDLGPERRLAREAVDEVNRTVARPLGFHVDLIGWEDTLSAAGRPQEIINEELRTCQMFVGMLWAKWGTPPDTTGKHTSGFEEEFSLATQLYADAGEPYIRQFFKNVDESQLKDPGPELTKVLSFKKTIIDEKKILFDTFSSADEFAQKLRLCVADYIHRLEYRYREQGGDTGKKASDGAVNGGPPSPSPSDQGHPGRALEADFLRSLADRLVSSPSNIAAVEVARARNLAFVLGNSTNDEQTLQPHDANLIYRGRGGLELSPAEMSSLADAGLSAFQSENAPLWYWLADRLSALPEWLAYSAIVGPKGIRINAFKVMALLDHEIPEGGGINGRREFIAGWFSDSVDTRVKAAALEYLGVCGKLSDLEFIEAEIARGDVGTTKAALEAALVLLSRSSLQQAAEFAVDNSFDQLSPAILNPALEGLVVTPLETLLRAVEHRSDVVRARAIMELGAKALLSDSLMAKATQDPSSIVRVAAFNVMKERGGEISDEEAEAILIKESGSGGGLLSKAGADARSREALELHRRSKLRRLRFSDLEAKVDLSSASRAAYFILCERQFSTRGSELRAAVDNRFVEMFEGYKAALTQKYGLDASEALLEIIDQGKQHTIRSWMRQAIDAISVKGGKDDLPRIRKALEEDAADPRPSDIEFIGKYGNTNDVQLIAKLAQDYRAGGLSATLLSGSSLVRAGAAATLRIMKGRLQALLEMELPAAIKASVIAQSPRNQFSSLPEDMLLKLLKEDGDAIRKAASLKIIVDFSKAAARKILRDYILSDEYRYYNVVFWLDLIEALPIQQARGVATKVLPSVAGS